jgi:hypothetical protein
MSSGHARATNAASQSERQIEVQVAARAGATRIVIHENPDPALRDEGCNRTQIAAAIR